MHKLQLQIGKFNASFSTERGVAGTEALSDNWKTLAEHMQTKVRQREQNINYLHTKAGFIIASIALIAQLLLTAGEASSSWQIYLLWAASALLLIALLAALWSLFINKSTTAPDGNIMGRTLLEEPDISKNAFYKWLAESYQAAYESFEKTYKHKDNAIRVSACAVIIAFIIIMVLRLV